MSDLVAEELLSIREARQQIPGRPHVSTVFRWVAKGIRGIKLESVLVGGRRFTSREAIGRFIRAISMRSRDALFTTITDDRCSAVERAMKRLGAAPPS